MEINPNPYASPGISTETAVASLVDSEIDCPDLPLEFRTPAETLSILIPIGIGMGTLFVLSLWASSFESYRQGYDNLTGLSSLAFAILAGFTAFGCLMAIRCKVSVDHSSIEIVDFKRRLIYFAEIVSWRQENATGTVYVTVKDQANPTPASNWAMTKESGTLVARVLLSKVGPPKG